MKESWFTSQTALLENVMRRRLSNVPDGCDDSLTFRATMVFTHMDWSRHATLVQNVGATESFAAAETRQTRCADVALSPTSMAIAKL